MFKGISYWKLIIAVILSAVISLLILNFELSNFLTLCISAIIFYGVYVIILIFCKEEFIFEIIKDIIVKLHVKK